ncbi:MAG: class I SAM-dependent methyltransferase [Glaciecola sp.]
MTPKETGSKYDKIATWWQRQHENSNYGISQLNTALKFVSGGGSALDVGCGAGGRLINLLDTNGFSVTGIDVSKEMVKLAKQTHIDHIFHHQDVCTFTPHNKYDFILAWDSIFHLPLSKQVDVLKTLCHALNDDGVIAYTFGHGKGEHYDTWRDDTFYYSSIGIQNNLNTIMDLGLTPVHLDFDQYPQRHVFIVAKKNMGEN